MKIIKDTVSEEELGESVVYIIPQISPGENVQINRKETKVDSPSLLLFLDLEPGVNWSHKCIYVLVGDNGRIQSKTEGQYPPDNEKLKVFSKPASAEDWMLLTTNMFNE